MKKAEPKHTEITIEEWMAELGSAELRTGGVTVEEIQKKTGRGAKTIRRFLRQAAEEGRLVVGRREVLAITGNRVYVPTYHIRPKPGK